MQREYSRNKKINMYGTAKDIAEAETILDTLDALEAEINGFRLQNESSIRLIIQEAIDIYKIKAKIMVARNIVYPYDKTVNQYERLKKSGKLEKMSNYFYEFRHFNFDIAHYSKIGYIAYYDNDFLTMKKAVLDRATAPSRFTDLIRILNIFKGCLLVMGHDYPNSRDYKNNKVNRD